MHGATPSPLTNCNTADVRRAGRLSGSVREHRSSANSWAVLVALARARGGRLSYQALSDSTHRSHRTVQYAVRELEQAGMIHVERCPEDRRRSEIALSSEGVAVLAEYREQLMLRIRELTGETDLG